MKRACLVASTPGYNLALAKMGNWLQRQGWQVINEREPFGIQADLYAFSVVFSWDVPRMIGQVNWVKPLGEVQIGGPATTSLAGHIEKATGIVPHIGPDWRFEEEPGDYRLIRTSRGCPVGCWFCIVPKMDGKNVRLFPNCSLSSSSSCAVIDDNFTATPDDHQKLICSRLAARRYRSIDFEEGFEPRFWNSRLFDYLRALPMCAFRSAFDEVGEAEYVERFIRFLRERDIPQSKIWVYVLAGGKEPFKSAKWRADKVLEWGGEPRIQPYKPLTWLRPRSIPFITKGWTRQQVVNLPRYYYGYYWRRVTFEEFLEQEHGEQGTIKIERTQMVMPL